MGLCKKMRTNRDYEDGDHDGYGEYAEYYKKAVSKRQSINSTQLKTKNKPKNKKDKNSDHNNMELDN